MLNNQKNYTIPKIAYGKGNLVFFRYFNEATNKWEVIKKKRGANKKSLKQSERKALLKSLRDTLEYKLEVQGWNPITNTYPQKTAEELEIEQLQNMNFKQALEFSLSKIKVATKTRACYRCTI